MANKSDGIKIGVFDKTNAQTPIPDEYLGKYIWYSKQFGCFAMTDENNKPFGDYFDIQKFKSFHDKTVIHYTNDSIKSFIEKEIRDAGLKDKPSKPNSQTNNEDYEQDYQDEYEDYDTDDYDEYDDEYDDDDDEYDNNEDEFYNDNADEDDYDYNELPARGRGRDRNRTSISEEQDALNVAKKTKDPTKHLKAFFITTFVISVVILIVLNFAEPIISRIAPMI